MMTPWPWVVPLAGKGACRMVVRGKLRENYTPTAVAGAGCCAWFRKPALNSMAI